ncbi:CoA pyrophosphatase [Delftia sp. PS-11]|uniref:CoA pyrophosphatase n=1 Tax=Delftia sp. PS-11 TaxID=2767222 RepID=UPI0024553EDF|nr:CoA pyrophosphatase [Delftia sp. PS-11]KAJ8746814.1 CoA pyrophosphatase [Delftia sp. PS-11]
MPPVADPRQAQLIGRDGHLPAVPPQARTPDALRRRFALPPLWEPEVVREKRFSDRQPADAAVLVPIVLRSEPTVLLTERTAHLSTHSGQVAFPGGKRDAGDASAQATALREAQEEVGLASSHVEVLGTLPVYVTGTAFVITPVVALVDPGARLQPNPGEVADVFEVPLAFLLDPANHERHAMVWNGVAREWFAMPYQDGARQRYIWGATAGMLRNLYRFLSA